MARVKGPNGFVVTVPESVASGLIGDGKRGFSLVEDPKPEQKPVAKRTIRKK